jgi:hypothetical protein
MGDRSSSGRGSPAQLDIFGNGKALTGYMSVWNTIAGEWSGIGKHVMHTNIEVASLATRRAKAYLDLPAELAACRQPQDFAKVQMMFWQTCIKQYAETTRRVSRQMAEAQMLTGIDESLSDPDSADVRSTRPQQRDFITFPEPKPEPAVASETEGTTAPDNNRHRAA